jgi:predicted TIM-barrel fold metal-dependent hydrolase
MQKILPALLVLWFSACSTLPPMADVHLHYNWDQAELTSAREAVEQLREHNVVLAVVFSVPSDEARELVEAGGDWIIPFYSPYYDARNRHTWFHDPAVVERTRQALASGYYQGIGEVHLVSTIGPRRDNPVFQGLLALAAEYRVPVNLHTEASNYRYLLPICEGHPKVRFIWAHAGGVMGPKDVEGLFSHCDNVWVEFSARDPWHYGNLTDEQGRLLPGWAEVIAAHPERFMVGTDPVWNAQQVYRWYEADEGWRHYGQLNRYHRAWLQQLPAELRQRLLLDNARAFFGVD